MQTQNLDNNLPEGIKFKKDFLINNFTPGEIEEILSLFSNEEINYLYNYCWEFLARKNQELPQELGWTVWLILAGRGWGKTRTGSETIKKLVKERKVRRIALVSATAGDARDVMIEGKSGILSVYPENAKPKYEPSKRRITWDNGTIATVYTGEKPDRLRGPEHDFAWVDEIAAYKYPKETYDNLMMGLRLGINPRCIITTTPRPLPIIKELINDEDTVLTTGSTYENKENLPKQFMKHITKKYEGTRLGRQELFAEILDDNPNALWNRDLLEDLKIKEQEVPELKRIVISIDPAAKSNKQSDETGIIVCGVDNSNKGYLLEDLSIKAKPNKWGSIAVDAYHDFKADLIIAESNNGGDMVEHVIKTVDETAPVKLIHASRGKYTRAEPVAAMYEQKRIKHVGTFGKLEDQMCNYIPGNNSPDRYDAMVWAFTELMLGRKRSYKKIKPQGLSSSSKWRR